MTKLGEKQMMALLARRHVRAPCITSNGKESSWNVSGVTWNHRAIYGLNKVTTLLSELKLKILYRLRDSGINLGRRHENRDISSSDSRLKIFTKKKY